MTESTTQSSQSHLQHGVDASVPCLYCSIGIPTEAFVPWTTSSRLISASCRACDRRVTLTIESLRELASLPRLATP